MIIYGKVNKKYKEALNFFASCLFTPQMKRNIEVTVCFRKNMGDHHGMVSVEDYNVIGSPRHFLIEIRKEDDQEEVIKTLAHEMVHVRQYVRNELNEEMTYWRGRRVNSDEIPYSEQPWEIEAEEIGNELFRKFQVDK
jgi:hypothetical protein